MKDQTDLLSACPALAAYIARVGAEQLNFRRFMIKEYRGNYYSERALIKIDNEGVVSCSNRDYAPTDEEVENIKSELRRVQFPRSILARDASGLKGLALGELYEFWSRREAGIIMVQERRQLKDGTKAYIPWSFFSDGVWRAMEPDGRLPFWKPRAENSRRARIMIHEGAKAAQEADALANSSASCAHPWLDELTQYEHWGMIGGALAPHRADYDEVRREKPIEVIYVCDNDAPGRGALSDVSKSYGGALKGVMFDSRWPQGWDMADAMPEKMFIGGRWIGPALADLMMPATSATEKVPNPEGGRPLTVMRRQFREEWYHCVTPEVFVHESWPNRILIGSEFNNLVAPFSDVDDTARLVKKDAASKTAQLKYNPAMKPGIYGSGDGGRYINTHVPSAVRAEEGDVALFEEFMDHLVVDARDRLELKRWCATLIARPEVRMLYGVLLISETQGIGKSTLGEKILAPLVGAANVSYPSEQEIVDSNFNYWLAHKRLAVVHEIYAGQSAKAYNRLKNILTDRYITVSKKYQANYEIENWMHVFACSNSKRAIQLSSDDRRWFVPKIVEKKKQLKFWGEFNAWLNEENGLGKIKAWAEKFVVEHGAVERGAGAPWSELKNEVVQEGYSPGMLLVSGFLENVKSVMEGDEAVRAAFMQRFAKPKAANGGWVAPEDCVILDVDLVQLIRDQIYEGRQNDRLERPLTIRKLAKNAGWKVSDGDARIKSWGTRNARARILCLGSGFLERSANELEGVIAPLNVRAAFEEFGSM